MTIEMLDRGTILVSLIKEEMRDYALSFSNDARPLEKELKKLLYQIGEVCGFDCRGKSWLIEALPGRGGCLLIISVRKARRRRYRIKRARSRCACVFLSADAMLDFLPRAEALLAGYRLYGHRDSYVLLPEGELSSDREAILSEYGRVCRADDAAVARVCEYGRLLADKVFQRRHVSGRAVAVRNAAAGRAAAGAEDLV